MPVDKIGHPAGARLHRLDDREDAPAAAGLLDRRAAAGLGRDGRPDDPGRLRGNERYLAMPVALGCVLAGAGWASLGKRPRTGWPRATRAAGPARSRRGTGGRRRPARDPAPEPARQGRHDAPLPGPAARRPAPAVDQYGGRERALDCGGIYAGAYNVAMVSWMLDVPGEAVDYQPSIPGVIFRGRSRNGVNPTPPVNEAWRPVTRAQANSPSSRPADRERITLTPADNLYPSRRWQP